MKKQIIILNKTVGWIFLFTLLISQSVMAQNQNTTVNGVTFNYPLSTYSASIDYSTSITATNCGFSASDWVNAIELGVNSGTAAVTITLSNPSTSLSFLLGALDEFNFETVSYVSNNGGGTVTLSTTNAGSSGCLNLIGNTLSSIGSGCNGRVQITATQPFTEVILSITGLYSVISSEASTVILPIHLIYFNGAISNCRTILNWKTGEELNFSSFEVLRSEDGVQFKKIATVQKKGSNSTYKLQMDTSTGGYFKLKINDIDGSYQYSNVIRLISKCQPKLKLLMPNPAYDKVTILGFEEGDAVEITNTLGQILLAKNTLRDNVLNVGHLRPGFYVVKIFSGSNSPINLKLLKQ